MEREISGPERGRCMYKGPEVGKDLVCSRWTRKSRTCLRIVGMSQNRGWLFK